MMGRDDIGTRGGDEVVVQRIEVEDTAAFTWLRVGWLTRLRERTTTYSIVTATIVLFMGILFVFELFEDDITVFEFWLSAVLLAASLLIPLQVFWMGRRFPAWVGIAVVITHAAVSMFYIGFSDERQNAIAGLQQLPLMAMYCAWFYGSRVARITQGIVMVLVAAAILFGPHGGQGGLLGPINLIGLVMFTWLCLEMGLFVRQRMLTQAHTDELTGALNRRGFMEQAKLELRRAQRYERPLTIAVLDLDSFKEINDIDGHAAGDDVLKSLVAQWISLSRPHDVLGRLGGDEFVMLLPESHADDAAHLLTRMRELAIHPWSWGVAEACAGEDVSAVIHRADEAMYIQKRDR